MPDTVIMMLNKWIWLPLIHIMKHMKPIFFTVPVALLYSAACLAASKPGAVPCDEVLAAYSTTKIHPNDFSRDALARSTLGS